MRKNERYLFLDIDGVLNTNRYIEYLYNNGNNQYDEDGYFFDPEAVANLSFILESVPDTKLIISSSWRFKGWDWMKRLWKKRKLPGTTSTNQQHDAKQQHTNSPDTRG